MEVTPLKAKQLDPHTVISYLEVPRSQIVLLQVYFELYEGIGTIRTVQSPPNEAGSNKRGTGDSTTVCLLTSPSNISICTQVLSAIREHVEWRETQCERDPFIESIPLER